MILSSDVGANFMFARNGITKGEHKVRPYGRSDRIRLIGPPFGKDFLLLASSKKMPVDGEIGQAVRFLVHLPINVGDLSGVKLL